jgi:hypothetical protein
MTTMRKVLDQRCLLATRPKVSLLSATLHHAIAVSGTSTASTPSDMNHAAEESRQWSELRTNPLRQGLS